MYNSQPNLLTTAVVQVGNERGFIVGAADDQRCVTTAAHCVPRSRYPFPHLSGAKIEIGMSRSPILNADGAAIGGVISPMPKDAA